ncbi:MAG: MarR family winged helix-turn-helix transcriptional regulator [Kocuria sp.]|nr:MarR family winged helix-turn-helix transcriptional regulator [Kocuria sp.]
MKVTTMRTNNVPNLHPPLDDSPTTSDSPAPEASPRWLSDDEQRTWRNFLFGSRAILRAMDKQLTRDSNLSGAEYEVLVPLSETPDGTIRSRELLSHLGWERSRLSHLLGRMEHRNLVERMSCDDDARGLIVSITPHGRRTIESAAPAHLAMVRAVFIDELTEEEARAINSMHSRIVARIQEHDLG